MSYRIAIGMPRSIAHGKINETHQVGVMGKIKGNKNSKIDKHTWSCNLPCYSILKNMTLMQPNQNDNFFQVYPYKKMKGTLEVI